MKKKFKQSESSTLVHICWYCGKAMLNSIETVELHEKKYCEALKKPKKV